MAPPQRYLSPAKQLLALGKRAKAEGLSFEEWWERAVRPGQPPVTTRKLAEGVPVTAVVWPSDTADRATEQAATEAMREGWRRAYEHLPPTVGERAMLALYAWAFEPDSSGIEAGSDVPLAASL